MNDLKKKIIDVCIEETNTCQTECSVARFLYESGFLSDNQAEILLETYNQKIKKVNQLVEVLATWEN